jgi:hypothetical protein
MDHFVMEELEWSTWIVSTVLVLSFGWYTGFGVLYGLIACIIQTTSKKITEALVGLHDLLDLLTHGVVEKIPRFNKNIPRDQLEDTFDGIGKNFLEQLKLKRGVTAFLSRILFGTILKVIKFFFLDNIVEELCGKKNLITLRIVPNSMRERKAVTPRLSFNCSRKFFPIPSKVSSSWSRGIILLNRGIFSTTPWVNRSSRS